MTIKNDCLWWTTLIMEAVRGKFLTLQGIQEDQLIIYESRCFGYRIDNTSRIIWIGGLLATVSRETHRLVIKSFSVDFEVISPKVIYRTLTLASLRSEALLSTFFHRNQVNFGWNRGHFNIWPQNSGSRPLWPSRHSATTSGHLLGPGMFAVFDFVVFVFVVIIFGVLDPTTLNLVHCVFREQSTRYKAG